MRYLLTEDTGAGLHFWKLVNQLFFNDALVVESKESNQGLLDAVLDLQANSAYSRGLSCASRYRYAISSGVSSETAELHFSQLIVRGVPVYVSLMALTITEFVSRSYIPNK